MTYFERARTTIIMTLIPVLLAGCSSWVEEHERAIDRARAHSWNKMLERHHNEPAASGPKWTMPTQQSEVYLAYLEQFAEKNIDGLMQQQPGLQCELDATTASYVIHQLPPEQVARNQMKLARTVSRESLGESITVLSGDCAQGELNGAVSALYTDNYYSRSEFVSGETKITGRIDGHFKNGVLHGEARVISIDNSNLGGSWRELRYFKIGVYDNGKPVGDQVMIAGAVDSRVIYVNQILEQNRVRMNSWMNGVPNTRFHTLNGENDGWMEFASAVLADSPSCYRQGVQLSTTSYCEQIALSLEQLARVEAPAGYARIDEIDGIDRFDGIDRVPQAVSSTTSKVEQRHQGSWQVPQVGFYSWLQPPANGSLKNANAAAYLPRLKAELSDDVAAQLTPGANQTCELDADTQSYLLFQLSAAEQASKRATQQGVGQGHRDGPVDIAVTEGQCSDGQLNGNFVVFYKYPYEFTTGAYKASSEIFGRIEGAFVNGVLQGELKRVWLQQAKPGSMAATEVGASLAQYEKGQRLEHEVHLLALPSSNSTRVVILGYRPDNRERVDIWLNGKRQISTVLHNGVNDGYIKYFDPALNNLQQCYRKGVEVSDKSYCERIGL